MSDYAHNILAVLKMCSKSRSAKLLANLYEGRVEQFLQQIVLSTDSVIKLAEGSEQEAEEMCAKIFRYGWLSPEGKFVRVAFAQHENTVREITGYGNCDTACEKGWVKFTVGLPYNHKGECLFEEDADGRLLTSAQRNWLEEWLISVAGEGTKWPSF